MVASGVSVEICLDDVGGARVAEAAGADRVELCAALTVGGLTPSLGLVRETLASVTTIDVQVLVRPRPGDFVLAPADLRVMATDVAAFLALPNPGVVLGFTLGALTPTGEVDEAALAVLVDAAAGAPVTFHKAFDAVPDPLAAVEVLAAHGVTRVLTSGGHPSALAGATALAALVAAAGDRLGVMAGGSVRAHDVAELVARTGVRDVHLRAPAEVPSPSRTGTTAYDSGTRTVTSGEQ
ncbi:MAG TPA: copper homeostasis protein CutC, partial [Actinotalea sp.]